MATREDELRAVDQIERILTDLGEESYTGRALEGCLDLARRNIEDDSWCSMKERRETAEAEAEQLRRRLDNAERRVRILEADLERELEWVPFEDSHNVSQADYDKLAANGARELTDGEAADLIADEFGFDRTKIRILREVGVYEINRHRQLRRIGSTPRKPLFDVWDWNYIRFDVDGNVTMSWEMSDGELRPFRA